VLTRDERDILTSELDAGMETSDDVRLAWVAEAVRDVSSSWNAASWSFSPRPTCEPTFNAFSPRDDRGRVVEARSR